MTDNMNSIICNSEQKYNKNSSKWLKLDPYGIGFEGVLHLIKGFYLVNVWIEHFRVSSF